MKFLLVGINSKYIHSNPAIYSLYAYSEKMYGDIIDLAEYTINQKTEEILADIYEKKPDAIGFSCYIWNWNVIRELLSDLTKVLPGTDIWLGGPQVSYIAKEVLDDFSNVKGVIIGEGEITFSEVVGVYMNQDNKDFTGVFGLCLRSGFTPPRETADFSTLPFMYHSTEPFNNRIIYYESSRGCPYRCSYCLSSIDKTLRIRDMELVKKELKFFLDNNVPQVKFVDRTFNCVHEHAMAVWQFLYENDNGITNFHFEISADIIKDEEIELLKKLRPGQVQLEIGVQTANEKTLDAINRKMNLERLRYVVSEIKNNHNIHQHLDLIAGLPYEDYESFGKSFDRVYEMRPDQLQLGFLKVLSGTLISSQIEEFGIAYTKQPPYEVLYTKWLSYDDVIRLKKIEEMVELYYNSNQFMNTLEFLVRAFSSPFAMFEALSDFFEINGYFVNSPSRVYRYEVLLNFASEYDFLNREIYKELLTFDLYLRENMKSRPGFCTDINADIHKDFRHNFYRNEEKERKYLPNLEQYNRRQLSGITHLEPFNYPVWDIERLTSYSNKVVKAENADVLADEDDGNDNKNENLSLHYVLFDYSIRNPLSHEAFTIKL
ncbi:MAG: B12-binding domain-containing radical SAM protein [Lachnospiraceae bacterium]|nr:B12-binding domain-containing radical SAM protein [Lachnospiraceae bacterium]